MSERARARLRKVFRRLWQAWPALLASLALDAALVSGGPEHPFPAYAAPTGAACIPSTITYAPTWWPACTAAGAVVTSGTVTATVTFPYASTAGQTATASSFLGIAGFNGATVDALKDVNSGQLITSLYGPTGNASNVNLPGALLTAAGKTRFILTGGSATVCTNLQATAGTLVSLINVGSATAVFPAFYDDAGATCATGARVYGNFTSLTLQAGQVVQLNVPLTAGVAYKLSGALSDNLVVVTQ